MKSNINYDDEMQKIIAKFLTKPTLLLHSCCAPCSSAVIERLRNDFEITVLYYNPNIEPLEEYEKRKNCQRQLLLKLGINFLDSDYDNDEYGDIVKDYLDEEEGKNRCTLCFKMRLQKCAKLASLNNFAYFGTTLTISPHKNAQIINAIGLELQNSGGIPFLVADFKKKDGYKRSIELSYQYELYRQDYCGCAQSKRHIEK